jgi:IS5 family transposase
MFKGFVLQHLNNISDDDTEYLIRDRYSFCRFFRLVLEDNIPDAKTIWLFREQLVQHQLDEALFDRFNQHLDQQGYQAKRGKQSKPVLLMFPSKETIVRKTFKSRQVKSLSGFRRMLMFKLRKTRMPAGQRKIRKPLWLQKPCISRQPA